MHTEQQLGPAPVERLGRCFYWRQQAPFPFFPFFVFFPLFSPVERNSEEGRTDLGRDESVHTFNQSKSPIIFFVSFPQ